MFSIFTSPDKQKAPANFMPGLTQATKNPKGIISLGFLLSFWQPRYPAFGRAGSFAPQHYC
jgi:hypothetical protein